MSLNGLVLLTGFMSGFFSRGLDAGFMSGIKIMSAFRFFQYEYPAAPAINMIVTIKIIKIFLRCIFMCL